MMHGISELQLSLIVIGALSVGGVWGYNLWQERKHRKLEQKVFRGGQHDVLMHEPPQAEAAEQAAASPFAHAPKAMGERIEPRFIAPAGEEEEIDAAAALAVADTPDGRADAADAANELAEPSALSPAPEDEAGAAVLEDAHDPVLPPSAAAVEDSDPPEELADPVTDCVVHLDAAELIAAPLFWAAQRQILSRLVNRVVWSGFEENSGCWQRLHANDASSYRHLVAALQLADRNGPVAADDLALYCDGVRQLAAHYQAQVLVPVVADVLSRARALDEFCASVDWRLSLNLMHAEGQVLAVDSLRQLGDIAGLRPCDKTQKMDGLLHGLDAQGMSTFTLSLFDGMRFDAAASPTTAGVTLTIDVPRVADGVAAFDRMTQVAELIGNRLGTVIVDDQRRILSGETLAMIRAKIGEFQQKMAAQRIPAGSRRALRLYA
ncbi:putative Cell division protein ZipA [Sterolibacterium denitrificans]|uniref:Cell division protein ZipA n=1 Tax=Sterolibacterium denitrificans TaxID=157592 RepID=A0A7Z7HRH8_9PROT|nr:cell division protein ZipA C-terminal FtsZ-binding domain-containing protein [Sterolibacterium denitrificans]SMB25831.1 putative Cell division protein ZipA [Sterolibacterium denitrificans]